MCFFVFRELVLACFVPIDEHHNIREGVAMKVITITCEKCKKDSYVRENDFPLYCSFCGSRTSIYYKAEKGCININKITVEKDEEDYD